MSSVLARFRKVSSFQPLTDARKLRGDLMNWALNENNIPKRKRILFIQELKDISNSLVMNIYKATFVYPSDKERLATRKDYISKAKANCSELFYELQFIDDVQEQNLSLDKIVHILELLDSLNIQLAKWKKSEKVIPEEDRASNLKEVRCFFVS